MKKQLIAGLILVSLGLSGQALALEVGKGSPYDYRIKSVVYNPVDVVRIDSVAGVATHIVVAPDESYVTHAFGDSNSYAFTHVENNMFIKPKGEVPSDTNLVLVTNKRTYNIVLHYVGDYTTKDAQGNVKANFIKTPWSMKNATLQLTYLYPFEDMKKANKTLESNRVKKALKDLCVFRSIRSRIGIEVRSAIRIHSINRELNFFYRFLTRFFAAFHYRGIFPQ